MNRNNTHKQVISSHSQLLLHQAGNNPLSTSEKQLVSPTLELELGDRGPGFCCIETESFWQHSNKECEVMMYNYLSERV